jgi:DNA-binding response OmpR family regulator
MRIPLVDDEEKVNRFIVRELKAEAYAVDPVPNGKAAQDYLASYAFDTIILALPGISGTDLLQHLRKKIDETYDEKLIRTVRVVGYSIGLSGT